MQTRRFYNNVFWKDESKIVAGGNECLAGVKLDIT